MIVPKNIGHQGGGHANAAYENEHDDAPQQVRVLTILLKTPIPVGRTAALDTGSVDGDDTLGHV